MNESNTLKDFLLLVANRREWKPTYNFVARAARMTQAPTFAYTLPRGVVMANPEWLVFLTLSDYVPGNSLNLLKEFVQEFKAHYEFASKLKDWVENPISLVRDVAKWLSNVPKDEEHFAQALMNSNSMFVPFHDIVDVEFKKGVVAVRPHHIQVTLKNNGMVIYQDPAVENAFKSLMGQFSGKWQPEFLNCLKSVAKQNPSK